MQTLLLALPLLPALSPVHDNDLSVLEEVRRVHPNQASNEDGGWAFTATIYVWGAGLDGDVGIGAATVDVDVGFGDLLDHLDIGGMFILEAQPVGASWSLILDVLYLDLEDDLDAADAEVTELITELDIAWSPAGWENTDIIAGLRYWDIEADLDVGPFMTGIEKGWVDPVVGVRGTVPLAETWSLRYRGDVGGFGVGSDFSYQVAFVFTHELGPSSRFHFGVRTLAVDYDDDGFVFDTQTSGPIMGWSWGI